MPRIADVLGEAEAEVRLVDARDDELRERIAAHNRDTEPAQAWRNVLRTVEETYARAAALASEV